MPRRRTELKWNTTTIEELAEHGLIIHDALDVSNGVHKLFRQKASTRTLPDGQTVRRRPRRIMIGPDLGNRLLTFVLEYPDRDGRSHVVTG